ncbi:hypothetical protein L3Q82_014356 [Scortum barcoo]|uniref:Uncharacterized protein n=1 Tax=Scortum barcoo TaxID=214431 RepID=A0ACB8VX37_9TELE|nr:hypothetical protein L3Q82_014356 [Scortum barcoo]
MRISTSKSDAMVLTWKGVVCPLRVGGEVLPQVEEFKYLGSYAVGVPDCCGVKKELSRKDKIVARNEFPLQGWLGAPLESEKLSHLGGAFGVEPLLLCIERSQLRWLGHLFGMPPGRLRYGDPGHAGETMSFSAGLGTHRLGVPPEELEEVSGSAAKQAHSHAAAIIFISSTAPSSSITDTNTVFRQGSTGRLRRE